MTTIRTSLLGRSLAAGLLLLLVLFGIFPLTTTLTGGYPNVGQLSESITSNFVVFWHSSDASLNAGLSAAVDYWARFHLIKAALALVLLVILIPLGGRLWSAYANADRLTRRLATGAAGLVHAAITLLTVLILVANIQGAIAPLSSALGLMPLGGGDRALGRVSQQVQADLAAGATSPALETLQADFVRYHAVMAGLSALVTVLLIGWGVHLLRQRARLARVERRPRRLLLAGAGCAVLLVGFFGLVTLANVSTAANPGPALAGFFAGGL